MRFRVLFSMALTLVLLGSVASGASARPQEGMRVTPNEPAEKDYPPMGAGCPACTTRTGGAGLTSSPANCQNYVWCDAIPLEIVPPTGLSDDRDIFFTIVELHWDGSAENDMDLRFFDNGQSTGTFEQLGSSESTKNPEVVRVANADLEQYNLVVINYNGANTGYKLKVRISMDPFTSPTEAVAPEPPKSAEPEAEETEDFTPPEDLSGEPDAPIASDPTLPPVVDAAGDSDFGFGFSDLDSRITVTPEDFAAGSGSSMPRTNETVNPAVLLASLIGAPALIVGSGAAFAWKRRRDLLI